ncbi:MAG: hypothetical protein A2845_00160 [Candidatus Lloydbacteria bacterium RIFCSPHIGHO2_01_FULL_49_22]|uniref:Uncharacterized protein n=1 Tax=Candidatus Lloydbacteria bacterium RIFCSPHIGHO2_01_FULL_49_22 TaxID=1798658 RepID=A0A1G2CZW7_9BACT|nr:MAG: hypothetical protein A2845_00160 [Candidatus Lloydbacteria bacterium RIFCSPHIGHO2_01_FULL_49_22]OGZ09281.1 MAG: hypothetical protein A3C14_05065 [Candidatus Lloydbacteria bacterium RIFCSPHIGHO2_02_FULL_50_18]
MKKLFLLASVILAVTFSPLALANKGDENRTASDPKQQTLEEIIIEKNSYVRPYLPKKIVGRGFAIGGCDPDGNIIPSRQGIRCFDVRSVDGKQAWRIRTIIHGTVDRVWKINSHKLTPWVVFDANNIGVLIFESSEAQQFAGSGNGNDPNLATDKRETPERNAAQEILDAIPKDALQRALGIIGGKGR